MAIVEKSRFGIYKANEALLTKDQRLQLDELRRKIQDNRGTYFDFYSAAKKYCNRFEDMMRSHGVRRKE